MTEAEVNADATLTAEQRGQNEGASERKKLVGRASIVGLGTLVSRLLGLGRTQALAGLFTLAETDAFWVAFTIPNALRALLGEGAVSSAVVPVLSAKLAGDGDDAAKAFFARARGVSLLALVVVTALGVTFARPVCEVFAAGYHDRPADFERTVMLTRLMFPYIFFMGTAALGMAALNAKRHFGVAAFAPALLNVAFLASAFTVFAFPDWFASHGIDRLYALAIGALVGGVLQVVAQWPALKKIGYLVRPRLDLRDPGVRDMLRRITPMFLGIGVYYIDITLSRRFLSELGVGAQSYFSFAMNLCDFPQGIFVMALSTAALPALATLAAKGNKDELAKTFSHGLGLGLFVAIPASVALVTIGTPIVTMLLQWGEFDALKSAETARALAWQGGAIWTVTTVRIVLPVFYALGDTRTPVIVSVLDLLAFIGLALALRGSMGHVGISIAVAGSSAVQMVLLLLGLTWRHRVLRAREIGASAARTLIASLVGGAGAWGVARLLTAQGTSAIDRILPGLIGSLVFVALFALAAWGAQSSELDVLLAAVGRRSRGRSATTG